jgi:hypothetical protein
MLLLGSVVLATAAAAQQSKPIPPVAGRRLKRLPELHSEVISGRFVAQTAGTRISAFSPNLETYIFEADLRGYTQMVKLTHEFLHQEARIPEGVLDYNEPRSLAAVRDSSCDESWGSLSTRRVVDSGGVIIGTRPDLVYTQGAPQPANEADEVIPCYVVGRITGKWSERLARSGR